MNIPEYKFGNIIPRSNESFGNGYLYDSTDHNMNSSEDSQHLETILQILFSKMSDDQATYNIPSFASSGLISPSSLPLGSSLPSSTNDPNSYHLLSIISLWFVLIINPTVILFGVIGNLLAIYILINCNIAKLPVSFYTIMLNISDTLNLLIPVFIFWLDNCFNRTSERGYFRDKSNFLCKALMCPDQLFAALSAWYMCAISFNRWYSVCRPSSYFLQHSFQAPRALPAPSTTHINETNDGQRKSSSGSVLPSSSSLILFCIPLDYCCCFINNIKYRQHLQAFRSIGIITLLGILCCLYPIFMHELRPILATNQHYFDLSQKITRTRAVIWQRCYYSRKHEYAYDIIGIILSCLLHILPLTFVAAMNIMIIVRLRQRQRIMSFRTNPIQSPALIQKKRTPLNYLRKHISYTKTDRIKSPLEFTTTIQKDQSTLTDSPPPTAQINQPQVVRKLPSTVPKRHQSRDRTITIMLVSVALSYLILTLPYRLFWSYNVYIKRMYPDKLNSSMYLLKMHYIDHVLRTIRNIHYGTNFVFFIFLSKTFRRKFRQLFMGKFLHTSHRFFHKNTNRNNIKTTEFQAHPSKLEETTENHPNEYFKRQIFNETPRLIGDARIEEDRLHSIVEFKRNDGLSEL